MSFFNNFQMINLLRVICSVFQLHLNRGIAILLTVLTKPRQEKLLLLRQDPQSVICTRLMCQKNQLSCDLW